LCVGEITNQKRIIPCLGIKINPMKMSLMEEAQNNFRKFLNGSIKEYCNILYKNHFIPTSFVHTSNDGLNGSFVQSYQCAVHKNAVSSVGKCDHCNNLDKSIRRKDPGLEAIPKKTYNKEIKTLNSEITK
jgi:hypothetical protein